MGKFGNICLLLGLVTYLYYYAVVEAVDCSNGAGYCDYYSNYLRCYITNNETQVAKSLISYCSGQSTAFVTIYVYKYYVSTVYGNLIIDIELASNIQYLYIYNSRDQDNIRLTTSSQNTGLTRIYLSSNYHFQLESGNFFNYFTGLKSIYTGYCITKETPSFTNLQYLTYLYARIIGSSTRTFDNTIARGLSNLVYLRFYNSDFTSITKGALDGLNSLTYLSFQNNKLSIIEDGTFNELSSMLQLHLQNNGIKIISNNVFEGLTELTYLNLEENPGFPIEALINTRSLRYVYLRYNDYHTLDPYVFQQLKSQTSIYIYVNDPFICDCRLQWTSIVSQYGVYIRNGYCSEPSIFFQNSITNPLLYTNCTQTESYQCFDKSITCPSNEVCHNTQNGYLCSCPKGYSLHNSGECRDFDECDEETECEHTCVNTQGSYHCVCDEGYKLAANGYVCDDVNECKIGNGGCEFGCGNTIGSYQCYCEQGHRLYNETHCESDIQCDVVDSSGYQENRFTCQGGFNLTITNLTCHSITEPTIPSTEQPTSCPIGYSLHNSGECKDFNECTEVTNCSYACQNTEGSYNCICEEGYKLAINGYDCEDANECHEWNGGCEFGCRNTIGSYLCYCEYGSQLINKTHCERSIKCDVADSSNYEEYRFVCDGGFNLTITNFTCQSTTITTSTTSTAQSTIPPTFCPIGYSLHNSGECKDFDECNEATDCAYACENTEGSYLCVCDEGYTLAANGYACDDINECQEGNGGCEFGCQNIIGSYLCYCQDGHQLINKTHCESNIQCDVVDRSGDEEYRFVCHGGFNLTITNLTCHGFPNPTSPSTTESTESPTNCPIGYSLHNSGECKDVDECDEETNCEHSCENSEGSYYCLCNEGYTVSTNGYDCEDTNECKEWNGGCEFGCRNTIGSFECYCEYGHQLINETHCESNIQCDVVDRSGDEEYRFVCHGGFNLTITNLTCHGFPNPTSPSTTESTESPTNCPIGYSLHNSGECKDVDECDEETNCEHSCENSEGSYYCLCNEGYTVSTNGYDCEDTNECKEWNGGCEFGCRNTIGSFECYCEYGHQLINETHCESNIQCDVVDGSGYQENRFICQGGFSLIITNLTCHSFPDPTSHSESTESPTNCPIGYSLHNSGECKDFDECDEETNCEHSCENTEGSYLCVCDEGYKLAANGYDCDDVNECQEANGGCEFGCRNIIGSFECYCEYGHQLINETHCESNIQCDVVDSSYHENRFICQGGFNITIYNHSFPNVDILGNTTHQTSDPTSSFTQQVMSTQNQFEWYQPTVILMIISLVSNVFLIFMFIALFLYFVRKNNKMHRILKAKDTNNHRIPRVGYSNEIYNSIHGSAQPDELKKTITKESELIEKKDPNLIAEVYPGSVQDEAVRYQIN
ncbi:Fibrillin-2-like [Oopsacas minuta]|uniref:Fibrillin-2-like n=1 Tax=Oopsacas minuta TaxID=111878 RepID=A0AAV7JGF6_9METZ|nr:Fibrillin-2-like [Oopsacas minuta]